MRSNAIRADGEGIAWSLGWLLGSLEARIGRLRTRPRGLGAVLAAVCLLLLVGLLPEVAPGAFLPRRNVHLLGSPFLLVLQGAGLLLGLRWVRYLTVFILAIGLLAFTRLFAGQALPASPGWLLVTGGMAAGLALLLLPAASDFFSAMRTPSVPRGPGDPPVG